MVPSTIKHHLLVDKAEDLAELHFDILRCRQAMASWQCWTLRGSSTSAHSAVLMIPFPVLHLNPFYIDTLTDQAGIEDVTTVTY